MSKQPIYLDHMATTPVDPRVVEAMVHALSNLPGNASVNSHIYGWEAEEAIRLAREQVAKLIGGDVRGVVWTSGATEANNLAIKGAVAQYARKGKHIITTAFEHAAVLQCFQYLASQGFDLTLIKPDEKGMIDPEQIAEAIRPDTLLVSVMHANNEVGTIQPIAKISEVLKDKGILFHVDAAQTLGKIPIDVNTMGVDLLSGSAHKCYGPKGMGVLYIRQQPRIRLQPQMQGGKQEQGIRSGTLPTHQIVGFGQACAIAQADMAEASTRLFAWREQLWDMLEEMPFLKMNGCRQNHLPGHLHFTALGRDAEVLVKAMPELALSTGSACQQESAQPSHVLTAMGLTAQEALSSLRLAFGRFNTQADFDLTASVLQRVLMRHTACK